MESHLVLPHAPPPHPDVEVTRRDTVFQGYFRVDRYHLRHRRVDGGWTEIFTREVFERGHAVGVLPYDPVSDRVVLVEQFRIAPYLAGRNPWMLEIVAGIIEPGEAMIDVARRELFEEAGLVARDLRPMQSVVLSPGAVTETIMLYCAWIDAASAPAHAGLAEENEEITVKPMSWDDARAMLTAGKIDNASTLAALGWLNLHRDELRHAWR